MIEPRDLTEMSNGTGGLKAESQAILGHLVFLDLLELKLSLEWFQESGSVHMSITLF